MDNVVKLHSKRKQTDYGARAKEFLEDLYARGIHSRVPIDELDKVLQAGGLTLGVTVDENGPRGIIMREDE